MIRTHPSNIKDTWSSYTTLHLWFILSTNKFKMKQCRKRTAQANRCFTWGCVPCENPWGRNSPQSLPGSVLSFMFTARHCLYCYRNVMSKASQVTPFALTVSAWCPTRHLIFPTVFHALQESPRRTCETILFRQHISSHSARGILLIKKKTLT